MFRKPIFQLLTLFLLFKPLAAQTSAVWEIIAEMPFPVAGGQAVVYEENIYILGGYFALPDPDFTINVIQKYHPQENFWECLVDSFACSFMQTGRSGFVSGVYDGKVYYCGGASEFPYLFILESWNFEAEDATTFNVNPEFNRTYGTGLVHHGKLYLVGGYPEAVDTLALSYIVEYDLATGGITFKDDSLFYPLELPYQQMSAILGDEIYIFGGAQFGIFRSVFKFNTIDHTFEELPELNSVLAGGAAVSDGENKIYIIGGYNESALALGSVYIYEVAPEGISLTAGPSLNIARQDFMAAYYYGSIYVFGGTDEHGDMVYEVEKLDIVTGIDPPKPRNLPGSYELLDNYPNPFNATTVIPFKMSKTAPVRLEIYSIMGERIATLIDRRMSAGNHRVEWNGNDQYGQPVGSGIYFYKLTVESDSKVKKMILVK